MNANTLMHGKNSSSSSVYFLFDFVRVWVRENFVVLRETTEMLRFKRCGISDIFMTFKTFVTFEKLSRVLVYLIKTSPAVGSCQVVADSHSHNVRPQSCPWLVVQLVEKSQWFFNTEIDKQMRHWLVNLSNLKLIYLNLFSWYLKTKKLSPFPYFMFLDLFLLRIRSKNFLNSSKTSENMERGGIN